MDKDKPDVGRKAVTGRDADTGKFRVPSLREAANLYPYFHDGSAARLEDAVALIWPAAARTTPIWPPVFAP